MKRVNNPETHLKNLLQPKQSYHVGFAAKQLTDIGKGIKEIKDLVNGSVEKIVANGKKGALKENTLGKFIRKVPEQKTSVWRHIDYYSYHHQQQITYDREFTVWEKELLYKHNLEISAARTPQGELILVFPLFKMEDSDKHFFMAGAAMNMAIQLGGFYMLYDEYFQPIIRITKTSDKSLLPAGSYGSVKDKLKTIERNLKAGGEIEDISGNSYRFAILQELEPTDITIGLGGFDEYLVFEYIEKDLLVYENLKTGNATYLFKMSEFKQQDDFNKQTARSNPGYLKRIVHENMDHWNKLLNEFFK